MARWKFIRPAPSPHASRRGTAHEIRLGRPRLLIIGCGDVGLRIVSRLAARFRIVALTSTPARAPLLRAVGVVPIIGDLDQRRSLRRLRGLATRVLHLAPPGPAQLVDTRTRHLVAALAGAVQRAVYVSTTGVYGDHGGRRIDETARLRPTNERAQRRADAERTVRRRWRGTVLRVPGIYAHDRLPLERLRQQLPALADADDVYSNHIHAEDRPHLYRGAARAQRALLQRGRRRCAENGRLLRRHCRRHRTAAPAPFAARAAQGRSVADDVFVHDRSRHSTQAQRELRFRLHYPTVAVALRSLEGKKTAPGGRRNELLRLAARYEYD